MSGIHDAVMDRVQAALQAALIDNIDEADPAIAGVVKQGYLQGDPDPDEARISVTIHENDPDRFDTGSDEWSDEVDEVEIGGAVTFSRKFTVKARALLERSAEELAQARSIASTLKERIELALLSEHFVGVSSGNEYVSRGPMSNDNWSTEMLQGGGPPDAYDFHIKVRFDVLTTRTGVV